MLGNNIFDQLKNEHKNVKSLLTKAESCPTDERKTVLEDIEMELVPHARAEEKTLYAVLLQNAKSSSDEDAENLANEAYEEHRTVDKLMDDIKACDPKDERWIAMLKVIKENLEHHIEEEENNLFKNAKKLLSESELDEILQAYNNAKEKNKEHLPSQGQISERRPSEELSRH